MRKRIDVFLMDQLLYEYTGHTIFFHRKRNSVDFLDLPP